MNWNNLEQTNCPKCSGKLTFKTRSRNVNMKVRGGKGQVRDMYYCCNCADFQISKTKFNYLVAGMIKEKEKKWKKGELLI